MKSAIGGLDAKSGHHREQRTVVLKKRFTGKISFKELRRREKASLEVLEPSFEKMIKAPGEGR